MRRPPPHPHALTHGIAALIGGMLGALLYALLGLARRDIARHRSEALGGTAPAALMAGTAIDLALEPIVEWVCVPAPWRAGQLLPWRHARTPRLAWCGERPAVRTRGPPAPAFTSRALRTGMA